jgi:hypothetical protein
MTSSFSVSTTAAIPKIVRRLTTAARLLSLLAILAGLAALFGWTFGVEVLKSVIPGQATMKPNTALCILMLGVGLATRGGSPSSQRLGGWVVAAIRNGSRRQPSPRTHDPEGDQP